MPAAIDLTGQRYGRLTAIRLDKSTGKRLWLFRCDCGEERLLNAALVRSGSTRSCGCLRKELTASARKIDLSGQRFGRLVVLHEIPERTRHRHIMWACLCDCGKQKNVTMQSLRKGSTQSCGCLHLEWASSLGSSSKKKNPYEGDDTLASRHKGLSA